MKDPIIEHIMNQRSKMDTETPSDHLWDNIKTELHPSKKKNRIIWWVAGAAACAAFLLVLNISTWESKQQESAESKILFPYKKDRPPTEHKDTTRKARLRALMAKKDVEYLSELSNPMMVRKSKDDSNEGPDGSISLSNDVIYNIAASDHISFHSTHDEYPQLNRNKALIDPQNPMVWTDASPFISTRPEDPFDKVDLFMGEAYNHIEENKFELTADNALSTFSIDVDGASYSNIRRYINNNILPPRNAIRIEEMVNYFNYDLQGPGKHDPHPFKFSHEIQPCPWNQDHYLLQVAIKGREIPKTQLPPSNLVFLVDVSGSMENTNKLDLVKKGMNLLVDQLREEDKVSIVVYAGAAGVVLDPTSGYNKMKIRHALKQLEAGGSTAGGEGIELAYRLAERHFNDEGNNRIILATDGDFNVGISDQDELIKLIEEKRQSGVFLSVMGYGMGNIQDGTMEQLANKGNGNYAYIDNLTEAKKVMVTEFGGTLFTIAKDIKLQLNFNSNVVESYRLVGYENRLLEDHEFDDDAIDAGDLGSGHSVVALYELVVNGDIKNQITAANCREVNSLDDQEWVGIQFRYKKPKESRSRLLKYSAKYQNQKPSNNFLMASSAAEFGLLLRHSEYKGNANYRNVISRAREAKGKDQHGYRSEFIQLLEMTEILQEEYDKRHPPISSKN